MPPKNRVDTVYEQVKQFSSEDLRELLEKLREEENRRDRIRREEDWRAVSSAIKNYIEKWGSISVYDEDYTIHITSRSDLQDIGEIDATY